MVFYIGESPSSDALSSLSSDGRYTAYVSDRTGQFEVYVQPFPATGQQWQVSIGGGEEPRWSSTGDRLYYRIGNRMMGVSVTYETAGLSFSLPYFIFETEFNNVPGHSWDLSADDTRFLILRQEASKTEVTHLNVVVNWFEELKRLVPADS